MHAGPARTADGVACRRTAPSRSPLDPERAGDPERGVQAVLVKSMEPVGAAIVRAVDAADLAPPLLRADRLAGVQRVAIDEPAQDAAFVNLTVWIERDAVLLRRAQSLKPIEVVGHHRRRRGVG